MKLDRVELIAFMACVCVCVCVCVDLDLDARAHIERLVCVGVYFPL